MKTEDRLKLIASNINDCEKDLKWGGFSAAEFYTDVYKLPITGRKVQIKVIIEADEDEFQRPSKDFRETINRQPSSKTQK